MIIYLIASNVFGLSHNVDVARPEGLVVDFTSDTLSLTQTLSSNIKPLSVSNQLNLQQVVNLSRPLRVSNYLQFTQQVSRPIELFANNLLAMTHLARTVTPLELSQFIGFTQSVEVTRGISNVITFTDSVSVTIVKNESLVDTLSFSQGVSVYKYNDPSFIQVTVPTLPAFTPVILTLGSLSVTLDVPDFGNSHEIEVARINRISRAGTLQVFRDSIWPETEVLNFRFNKLSEAKAQSFMQFVAETLGKEITMTDHEGVVWNGIIMNPDAEIICNDKSCEPYETELVFQGVKA